MAKEKLGRDLKGYLSSRSAYRWQELCTGVVTEHGKQPCNGNRNDPSEELVRSKVEKYKTNYVCQEEPYGARLSRTVL